MESTVDSNGGGSRLVMTELSHIRELVKQLDVHLGGCDDLCKHLAAQISTVTERSLNMIMSGHFGRKRSAAGADIDSPPSSETPTPLSGVSRMPFYKENKKRKMMGKGKRQVRMRSAGAGADVPEDDGFSWRKYGQKEILGAQYPRAYYRCTHQKTQGCSAFKQVQRADEDPAFFDVTYHGTHTCGHKTAAAASVQQAAANPDAGCLLQSLRSTLTVNTAEGLMSGPQQGWSRTAPFSFSPAASGLTLPELFSTPSTPENCFGQGVSVSPSQLQLSPATSDTSNFPMDTFEAGSEYDQILSALVAAGSTQQPAMDVEEAAFSLDDLDFDISYFLVDLA